MNFNDIFEEIKSSPEKHPRDNKEYKRLESELLELVQKSGFISGGSSKDNFGPFGEISFPDLKMGTIDSLDLFGLDEVIIFSYYYNNRHRYKKVSDIGANIGLHSLLMSKCGYQVEAYEPDPRHIEIIENNFKLNNVNSVKINQVAVSLNDENLFIFETTYTEILGIYVPEKSEFRLGLKGISQWSARNPFGGPTEDRTDFEALAKKAGVDPDKDEFSGNIIMTFSKYRLNKGLKDKLFK